MPYATSDDFIARFGEREAISLTDFNSLGAVDIGVLGTALEDASSIVDTYVGGRYSVPLIYVPPMICNAVCNIARFQLCSTEGSEAVKALYEKTIGLLKDVSAGRSDLGANVQGKTQTSEANRIQFGAGRPNIFGRRE